MPMGICKLCLKHRNLRDSHLIPKAMFKYVRHANVRAGWQNPDPIAMVKTVTSHTSKQVSHYVLCDQCEDRFNKNGEIWMLKHVSKDMSFPLLDRLNLARHLFSFQGAPAFSGTSVGFDMDKLGYFALSVFWRAAVRSWNLPFGEKTTKLNLGGAKAGIRRFLVGKGAVPQDIALIASVCTDQESQGVIMTPGRHHGNFHGLPGYGMTTLGVHFILLIGKLSPTIQGLCCFHSSKRVLFLRDCKQNTVQAYARLFATSKPSKGVLANKKKT